VSRRLSDRTELLGGYSFGKPAVNAASTDMITTIDVPMHRFSAGVAHRWSEGFETIVGAVGGAGRRRTDEATFRLSGFQLMLETRLGF